jgi:bacillolysin/thermolysin
MVFGEGYAAPLDVTAHELTHAITDRTADLVYECQSGALNESFSDIFASNVDTGDWEIGEDLPGGPLRDMADPARFGDPAHVDDYDTRPNDDDPFNDHGAVHSNSGIPNHVYYLIVQNIGRKDAEQVMYRVLTEELEPTSGFEDFRTASLEVARDLFGERSPQYAQIDQSFAAVGLDGSWVAPEVEGC